MTRRVSGFTFAHNALEAGMPLVEAILAVRPFVDEITAVDMESTDGTRLVLDRLCDLVLEEPWGLEGGWPMRRAFRRSVECWGDQIVFFEADCVFDPRLAREAASRDGDWCVWRVQVGQNFQRVRWYPHPVHRVFPRGRGSYLESPTTPPGDVPRIGPEHGFLWDCSSTFRGNFEQRMANKRALWPDPNRQGMGQAGEPQEIDLSEPHWGWAASPLALPESLRALVGREHY